MIKNFTKSIVYRGVCKIEITVFNTLFENFLMRIMFWSNPNLPVGGRTLLSVSERLPCKVRHLCLAGIQTFLVVATHPGAPFLLVPLKACRLSAALPNGNKSALLKGLSSMPCSFLAAGGAVVVFIVVQVNHQSSKKGDQAGRRCGRQTSDLSGLATLVLRAPSAQTILLHRISSCWMPSIQPCIRAERKGH